MQFITTEFDYNFQVSLLINLITLRFRSMQILFHQMCRKNSSFTLSFNSSFPFLILYSLYFSFYFHSIFFSIFNKMKNKLIFHFIFIRFSFLFLIEWKINLFFMLFSFYFSFYFQRILFSFCFCTYSVLLIPECPAFFVHRNIFLDYISFLVINRKLFLLYNFSKFLYILHFLGPDDGSAEPKRYRVDFVSQ